MKKNIDKHNDNINRLIEKRSRYKEGFFTHVESEEIENGINENIIKMISKKRFEPEWLLKFRLQAYEIWLKMKEPHWLKGKYEPIDYNRYIYYSAPKCNNCSESSNKKNNNKDNYLTKEVQRTFDKLGVPIKKEHPDLAIDAIFDSVSVSTTHSQKLLESGILFCSLNEAVQKYPNLVRKYLSTVVPINDNFFSSLNSAVFSDGTFVYIPKDVHCPIELSTYFRINSANTAQFERTIIIADENSYVSYMEGCSAPIRNQHQLHAAVVEVVLLKNSIVKYSTVQNWFPGTKNSKKGGILNFVTKRAICIGENSRMSWTQSETGSAITWKYPSVILKGNNSTGEFFSVSLTNGNQQADTGTKMIHIGENTKSTIISKGISSGKSSNTYRGIVKIISSAKNSRNFTQCDSLLLGSACSAHTFPSVKVYNNASQVEHEASTSRISEEQLFYCLQRGITKSEAISMIIKGFCNEVFSRFPLEFAIEAQKLLTINLINSIA